MGRNSWMDARRLVLCLLTTTLTLAVPLPGRAATYKLPVESATLVVSAEDYLSISGPDLGVPYNLYINPPVLRFGADASLGLVYESVVVFDWGELQSVPGGSIASAALFLTPISVPAGVASCSFVQGIEVDQLEPLASEFDWYGKLQGSGGGIVVLQCFDPAVPGLSIYGASPPLPTGYGGWILSTLGCGSAPVEIAGTNNGLGFEAPYMLVMTVPEPSCAICLVSAILPLGGLLCTGRRRMIRAATLATVGVVAVLAGTVLADEDIQVVDSEPGSAACVAEGAIPPLPDRALPGGFTYLPAFPRFLWSYGCVPTSGAMIVGYYSNAGFPDLCRQKVGGSYTAYLCPTANYPSDNLPFLKSGEQLSYPSRCAISATEKAVFGRGESDYGHADDYYIAWADATDPYVTHHSSSPHWTRNYPWSQQGLHSNDCLADFMGTSIKWMRNNSDGGSQVMFAANSGDAYPWKPPTCAPTNELYPYPNTPPETGDGSYSTKPIDATYGLGRYITDFGGYHSTESYARDFTGPYYDVWSYSNQYVNGCRIPGTSPPYTLDPNEGATGQSTRSEIDAGRPVIVSVVETSSGSRHAFPVFGYKEEEGQPLQMLAYDTWYEDALEDGRTYRIVPFPTATQAGTATYYSLTRRSESTHWRVYAVSFLRIERHDNDLDRCAAPLADAQSPSDIAHAEEFDLVMSGQNEQGRVSFGDCSKVYYDHRDPTPASNYVSVVNGTATLHIDHDCSLAFRTYKDVSAPDGYIASKVVRRVYSIFSTNKNVKKYADETEVTMVNGTVTHVVDANRFYFEERDKRLFGIRVHKASHGLSAGDEVEVVVGTIDTDPSNDERFIDATSISETDPPTKVITPYCMKNTCVGGSDYAPPLPAG
jgi:hypothetical protein